MTERPSRPRSRGFVVGVVALVLVVGVGVGFGAALLLGGDAPPEPVADRPEADAGGDPDALAPLPEPGEPVDPASATDPEAAVTGFLTAEARGDFAASYEFLTANERDSVFTSVGAWEQAHGNFPRIVAFEVEEVVEGSEPAQVVTLTGFEPTLDPVLGLVPARGRSSWATVGEDGVWRVASADSSNQFLYPSAEGVAAAAEAWAQGRAACEDTSALEQGLIGSPVLAEQLCEAGDDPRLGSVGMLSDSDDTTALVSAWGPEVFAWARVVRVLAPAEMDIVLAPIGEEWKVVAVIGSGFGG